MALKKVYVFKIPLFEHHEKTRLATIKAHEDFNIALQEFNTDPKNEAMTQKEYDLIMSYTFGAEDLTTIKKAYLIIDIEDNGTKEIAISINDKFAKIDDFTEYQNQAMVVSLTKTMVESIYKSENDYKVMLDQVSSWANYNYPIFNESGMMDQSNVVEKQPEKKKSIFGCFATLCGSSKAKNSSIKYVYEGPRNEDGKRHGEMGKYIIVDSSHKNMYPRKVVLYEGSWKCDRKDGQGRLWYDSGHLKYNGFFVKDLFDGSGKLYTDPSKVVNMEQSDANSNVQFLVYHGSFQEGKRYGEGTQFNYKGDILFKGMWQNDLYYTHSKTNKPSIMFYESKNNQPPNLKYEGHFKNGLMHGNDGVFYLDDPSKIVEYYGNFERDNRQEKGMLFQEKKYDKQPHEDQPENQYKQFVHYKGEFNKNKINGYGILYNSETGSKLYEGKFRDEQYWGYGKLYKMPGKNSKLKEGLQYEGDFVNGKFHGKGQFYDPSNDNFLLYMGDFKNGMFHGTGKFLMKNGKVLYDGEWKEGKKHGEGLLYAETTGYLLYEGDFKIDLYDGSGKLFDKDQLLEHQGKFKDGQKEGSGTSYWQNGKKKQTGNWKKDLLEGSGKEYHKENGQLKYKGKFDQGKKNGDGGIEYFLNKTEDSTGPKKYEGQYQEDKWHGDGKLWDEKTGNSKKVRYKFGADLN